jgi:hypothetical protein
MWHSIYLLSNGVFTGAQVNLVPFSAEKLAACTPPGCGALEGQHDSQAVRLDLASGELVAYQPPAPADTDWQTWAWDAPTWRWVATPTTAALAVQVRAERAARLAACDWVVARAMELAEAVPAPWLAYRAALRDVPEQSGFPASVDWPEPPAV